MGAAALAASRAVLPPGTRPPGVPFADALPVPDGAEAIEQLVAWQGRDPSWRPAV